MNIADLIGNYVFPIVACCAMGWYVVHTDDKRSKEIKEYNELHAQEVDALREAVNNNTVAIVKLVERIEGDK